MHAPPNRIRRPANSFLHYRTAMVKQLQEDADRRGRKRPTQSALSRTIAEMWHAESLDNKAPYYLLAAEQKAEHLRAYPDYRYRPQRNRRKTDKAKTVEAQDASPTFEATSSLASLSSTGTSPDPSTPATSTGGRLQVPFNFDFGFNPNPMGHGAAHKDTTSQDLGFEQGYNNFTWSARISQWAGQSPVQQPSSLSQVPQSLPQSQQAKLGPQSVMPQEDITFCPPSLPKYQTDFDIMNAPIKPNVVLPQQQSEDRMSLPQLEYWNEDCAPLDAGFCEFGNALQNVSAPPPSTVPSNVFDPLSIIVPAGPSQTELTQCWDEALAKLEGLNLSPLGFPGMFDIDQYAPALAPYLHDALPPSAPVPFDESLLLAPEVAAFHQDIMFDLTLTTDLQNFDFNMPSSGGAPLPDPLVDPLQMLPSSAIWPEELNTFVANN